MILVFCTLVLILPPEFQSQTSREQQIQQERQKKAAALSPDELGPVEKVIDDTQRTIPRFMNFGPVHIRSGESRTMPGFPSDPK